MDYLIFHLALRNLDNSTRIAFERKLSSQTMPTYQSLIEFVNEACKTQELMAPTPTNSQYRKITPLLLSQKKKYTASRAAETPLKHVNPCIACKLQHPLHRCTVVNEMSYQKRLDVVTGSRRCYRFWLSFGKELFL